MFTPRDLLILAPERSVLEGAAGQFARRIFILALAEPAAPGNRAFLSRILAAAQLDLERDTLYAEAAAADRVSLLPAIKEKQAEFILVFGRTPAQCGLALELPPYQPTAFYQTNLLFADALSALEPDKTRKGQLWLALKQWFVG